MVAGTFGILIWRMHEMNRKIHQVSRQVSAVPQSSRMYNIIDQSEFPHDLPDVPLIAVMIEPRDHPHLKHVISNFQQNLPQVPIVIFHGNANKDTLASMTDLFLVNLGVNNLSIEQYNCILTNPKFYQSLTGTHILVFQTDSVLFSNTTMKLEDYFQYDYVGAPWKGYNFVRVGSKRVRIGNGGLSLRKRETMIKATTKYPYLSEVYELSNTAEDAYFARVLTLMEAELPTPEQAADLFFEYVKGRALPFGAHKYLPDHPDITESERLILTK